MATVKSKILLILIFLSVFAAVALAVESDGSMKIYAVTTDGEGLVATLHLEIEPGSGKIWSAVTPLVGTSTQNAERTAVEVAKRFYPNAMDYDYKFTIDSPASVVDGPSAGAAMALLTVSMLRDRPVPDYVSLTGTIREDGSVGPVGGVFEKAKEASKTGVKLFLIPKGEAVQTVKLPEGVRSVNLVEYAPQTWGIKVAEVDTIENALKLANSRLEDINAVSAPEQNQVPEFVPQKIEIEPGLSTFKALTTNYINETKQANAEAKNALLASLLEDPAITHSLLEALNNSERTLQKAEILNEQNYLYSAANFAFLARVDATIVREVSVNPRLLEENSAALDIKIFELKKEIDNFQNDLDENPSKEGVEWLASAQQRFTYAKTAVQKLSTEQTVIVGGTAEERIGAAFVRVQDYAFAAEWLGVSKDFYELSRQSDSFVKRPDTFARTMDPLIEGAKSDLNSIEGEGEKEDILRRVNSAEAEKEMGWYEASYFDAASARALLDSEEAIKGKGHDALKAILAQKITAVEKSISDSKPQPGWTNLYLDHAKYYFAAAEYYEDLNLTENSSNNLRSGYGLVLLAENISKAAGEVHAVYSALPPAPKSENGNPNGSTQIIIQGGNNFTQIAILLLLVALILVLGIMAIGLSGSQRTRKFSILKEISEVKAKIKRADEQFMRGKINASAHGELVGNYNAELAVLESDRKRKASHMLAVDNYSTEISSYNERLRDLRKHLKEGVISSVEFSEKSKEYLAKIGEMKMALHSEIDEISKADFNAAEDISKPMLPVLVGKEELVAVKGKQKSNAKTKKAVKKKNGGAGIRNIAKDALKKENKKGKRKKSKK